MLGLATRISSRISRLTRLTRLTDAINRVGIQNVSLLSRMTRMPKETIRYEVKKRFPKLGLSVALQMGYDRLGLERTFAVLEFTSDVLDYAPELLHRLASVAFLTYRSSEIFGTRQIAIFGVPFGLRKKFGSFLNRLVDEGILRRFRLEKLEWARHYDLRSEYYDISRGSWSIDWDRVKALKERPPAPPLTMEASGRTDVDLMDILLVKELELESWRNISDIAKKLGLNDRTARWHYTKHVSPMISSFFVRWLPATAIGVTNLMGLTFEFTRLSTSQLAKVRQLFANFPFSWYEGGREDGYHIAMSAMPAEHVVQSMHFLKAKSEGVISESKVYGLDLSQSSAYTIPYENFDEKVRWFFDEKKALRSILSARAQVKKLGGAFSEDQAPFRRRRMLDVPQAGREKVG